MEGEVASEVRSASSGEQPRVYFHTNPVPRRAFNAKDGSAAKAWAQSNRFLAKNALYRIRCALSATFLPSGYPKSVPQEYLDFQVWNVLQDLTSSLRYILATQKMLEGMGVGRAGVTSIIATMQWMARDGAAMVGSLVFTAVAGASIGLNVKKWCAQHWRSRKKGAHCAYLCPCPILIVAPLSIPPRTMSTDNLFRARVLIWRGR